MMIGSRRKARTARAWSLGSAAVFAGLLAVAPAATAQTPNTVRVEPDGTVHAPAMTVPLSDMLSPEARAYVAEHLVQMQQPELLAQDNGVPIFMKPYLARQMELFPHQRADTTIAGVHAYDYTPQGGVPASQQDRVLINLHGGGFMGCFPGCAELESIPLTALGGYRVIALDYRQAPEHRFPAASEDVAAVYAELLKTYPAQNIGIYGCSAGGMLTSMSVAWFQKQGLPRPGAIGIFCAGATMSSAGFGGDADYFNGPLGDARMPPPWPRPTPAQGSGLPYFAGIDVRDPLVSPATSDDVLRQFPPTLIITGTRGFELSSSVYTHTQLVRVGVEADLHVWEGLFHGFFYNADVPESRQAYDVMLRFFDRHLGR